MPSFRTVKGPSEDRKEREEAEKGKGEGEGEGEMKDEPCLENQR